MYELAPPINRQSLERVITKVGVKATDETNASGGYYGSGYDKYRQLAGIFYRGWDETLKESKPSDLYPNTENVEKLDNCKVSLEYLARKSSGVYHGFDVVGMLLGMSVAAYNRWQPKERRTVEELLAMQTNPRTIQDIPVMLADMPNDVNGRFEEALCVFDGAYSYAMEAGDVTLRAFKREDEETGEFKPDLVRVIQTFGHELLIAAKEESEFSCPAQRFIPILWTSMATYAASDPRFYATDIEAA